MTDKNKEVAIGGTSILHKSDSFDQVQAVANYLQKAKQELGDCPAYQKLQSAVYEKAAKLSASTQNIDAEFFSLRETARIECKNAQNALKKELTLTVSNPKKASEKA